MFHPYMLKKAWYTNFPRVLILSGPHAGLRTVVPTFILSLDLFAKADFPIFIAMENFIIRI